MFCRGCGQPVAGFEDAADNTLLPPCPTFFQLSICRQTRKFCAGPCSTGGTIVRSAGTQYEVATVCDGPVVVLDVRSDAPVVIERVRNRAVALELVAHVNDGHELTGRLRKRVLTGSKRAKARRRITRAK